MNSPTRRARGDRRRAHVARHRARLDPHQGVPDRRDPAVVLAVGSHEWENQFVDRVWTYSLDDVWSGLQAAYADLVADVERRYGVRLETLGAIGVSAMMHGYLAFDARRRTARAVPHVAQHDAPARGIAELTDAVRHQHPAALVDRPPAPGRARRRAARRRACGSLTTLAGYVHWRLTGRKVLGVGDASGMFPIDSGDARLRRRAARRASTRSSPTRRPAAARDAAARGARRRAAARASSPPRAPRCSTRPARCGPASRSARPRAMPAPAWSRRTRSPRAPATSAPARASSRWSCSSGRSRSVHHELDLVTTPAGDPVAMVHCNNGASELAAWAGAVRPVRRGRRARPLDADAVFDALFREALDGRGGCRRAARLQPPRGRADRRARPRAGRCSCARPTAGFTLANFMRAQLYGVFGTLSLGMRVLDGEGVALDRMFAHGGMFRTAGVAQRFLAGALDAPVAVGETASEGGAWGIAVLAVVPRRTPPRPTSADYLERARLRRMPASHVVDPDPADVAGFAAYLDRYRAGLAVERAAGRHAL